MSEDELSIESLSDFDNDSDLDDNFNDDESMTSKSSTNKQSRSKQLKNKATKIKKDDEENDTNEEDSDLSDIEDLDDFENSEEDIDDNSEESDISDIDDDTTSRLKLVNDTDTIITNNKKNVILNKEDYKSHPWLSIYEYTKILSERANQLLSGAKLMLNIPNDINPGDTNQKAKDLAKQYAILEIKNKVCPFKIIRRINDKIEIWDVNDLELLEDE